MTDITFVTGNKKKSIEAQAILGFPIKTKNAELDEIQDLDITKLVTHKAQQAYKIIKKPLFVDDVGLYVKAWNGFPGPFIKWIISSGENDLLLKMLKGEENRNASVKVAIGFHDGKNIQVFTGELKGKISKTAKGNNSQRGWFDAVFIPNGHKKTFAEMTLEEKNNISHRKIALEKFKTFLKKNKYIV